MATVYLRPSADVTLNHTKSSGSSGYALISEVTADGDSTYIYHSITAGSTTASSGNKESTFTVSGNIGTDKLIKSASFVANARCDKDSDKNDLILTCGSNSITKGVNGSYTNYSLSVNTSDITYNSSTGEATATIKIKTDLTAAKRVTADLRVTQAYLQLEVESQYTITGGNVEGGIVYVGTSSNPSTTSCVVGESGTVYVKCVANSGYSLANWSVSGGSSSSGTSTTGSFSGLTGDCTVSATFSLASYTVSAQSSGGGSVQVSKSSSGGFSSSVSATINDTIYIKCSPADYYNFSSWSASGGSTATGTGLEGSISGITGNTTITGTFSPVRYWIRPVTAPDYQGIGKQFETRLRIQGSGTWVTDESISVTHFDVIDVSVSSGPGYLCDGWECDGDVVSVYDGPRSETEVNGTLSGVSSVVYISPLIHAKQYTVEVMFPAEEGNNSMVYVGTTTNPNTTSCTATINNTVHVLCVPGDSSYSLERWWISSGSANSYNTTTLTDGYINRINSDIVISATFKRAVTVSLGSSITGGAVYFGTSPNPTENTPITVLEGSRVYVKVVPGVGNTLNSWTAEGCSRYTDNTSKNGGYFVVGTSNVTVSASFNIYHFPTSTKVEKSGIVVSQDFSEYRISCKYDNKIYTEPDGTLWLHIFHHNNPASGLFEITDDFENGCFLDENTWFNINVCKYLGKWEFLYTQTQTSESTMQKYRWIQNVSPWTATYNDVTSNRVTKITGDEYSVVSYAGGLYKFNSSAYMVIANETNGNWYGAMGAWTPWNSGIPGYPNVEVSSGCIDLYVRIDNVSQNTDLNEIRFGRNLIETNEIKEI